jgi:hypothetical protein
MTDDDGERQIMEDAIPRHPLTDEAEVYGRKKPCLRHGPILIRPTHPGTYTASCVTCGLAGPEREDGWEAKLAFDEALGPYAPNLPEKLSEKGYEQRSKHEFGRYTEYDMGKREPFDRP